MNLQPVLEPVDLGSIKLRNRVVFDLDKANAYILEGKADAVAFGKPFISNPDLVDRFRENSPLAEWDDATFYTGGERGYTDYPMLTKKNNK